MSNWAVLFDWDGVVIDSSSMHEKKLGNSCRRVFIIVT